MNFIILHDFEVRNALENDVIQIRRPVNPKPPEWIERFGYTCFTPKGSISGRGIYGNEGPAEQFFKCPFGEVGKPLWIKETWQAVSPDENYRPLEECDIIYAASDHHPGFLASEYRCHNGFKNDDGADVVYPWKSSVHMPQSVSRLTIVPEEIWVERVQDIADVDVMDEGVVPLICPGDYREAFKNLWDSIYSKKGFGWENNLPVWAGKFRVTERK